MTIVKKLIEYNNNGNKIQAIFGLALIKRNI